MKGKTLGEEGVEHSHDCLDLSILRKPISTSITGFNEARKAYENGTEEVRQLMTNECDIVYECKVCRNIFRSLANFISHKRVYCRQKFNASQHFHFPSNGFIDQDISTIIQAEQEYTNYSVKDKPPEAVGKDLSSIIDRLTAKKSVERIMRLSDFYDRVHHKLTQDEVIQRNHVLQLDRTPGSSVAVYQTVKQPDTDSMRVEVEEVRGLLMDNKAVLGPDGKAIQLNDIPPLPPILNLDDLDASSSRETVSCKICHMKFVTEKTLKLHLEAKHIHSTYVYQCPACPQTFLTPAAVIRHLSNDHKKSLKRIRLMRDTIYKRRIRMDEVQVKGPSRELVRLQTDQERQEADNKAWLENVENYDVGQSICTYCGKTFERRAVLTTHLNNCRQKRRTATVTSSMAKKAEKPKKSTVELMKEISLSHQDENSNSFDSCTTSVSTNKEIIQSNLHNKLNASIDVEAVDSDNSNEKSEVAREAAPVNKRKRKRAGKVGNDKERPESVADEIYWSMDESGVLSVKKFAKDSDCLPPPPPPGATVSPNSKDKKPEGAEKLPECDICNKTFVTKSNLKRHNVMFHYFKNRFLCKLCDFGANKKLELIAHLGVRHSIMGDKHVVKEFITLAKEENREIMRERNEMSPRSSSNSTSLPASLCPSPQTVEPIEDSTSNSSSVPEAGPPAPKRRGRPKGSKNIKSSLDSELTQRGAKVMKEESKSPKDEKKKQASDNIPRRPIRNRIKPVNKDFVYDLSHLLKKESDIFKGIFLDQTPVVKKRGRSSQNTSNSTPTSVNSVKIEVEKPKSPEPAPAPPQNVSQARSPDEEVTQKGFSWSEKSLPSTPKKGKRSMKQMRRISDDVVIKGARKQRHRKQSTPVLSVIAPEYRHDDAKGAARSDEAKKEDESVVKRGHTEKDFQEFLLANMRDSASEDSLFGSSQNIPLSFTNSNGKRITLLERLAENKNRKPDAVHRLSNPFEDDSSDEYID
ncbi:zinc finger protein 800 isoform X2 [Phlebotomus argentipes]|uniref:zinc finger protein 800 isoform X2 n=1 Tax=Phlebotomus argentipes TaxID=94469 RepID=UPI002893107D|nr:zinc finger protein 800 isoform X2 [Phlebotomus argentipes]